MLQAQNIVFVTDNPAQALTAPSNYALLFSADPAYQQWTAIVEQARAQHRPFLGTWCDCRTTFPAEALNLQHAHRLDTWCGQGESDLEVTVALAADAPLLVGNANAWTAPNRQRVTDRINAGLLSFTQEAYTNAGNPWPENTSAAGVPAASLTIGLYDASAEQPGVGRYIPVAEYKQHTPPNLWWSISAYVSGVHPGELEQLPQGAPLPPPPPPPPPDAPPSATVVRREIANIAKAWESNNQGGNRRARISVARRIVDVGSTDPRWNGVSNRIANLLDQAGIR